MRKGLAAAPLLLRLTVRTLGAALALGLVWELVVLGQVLWWRSHDPQQTAFMAQRLQERSERGQGILYPHPWHPYARIPTTLKRAVIAAEDSRFVEHHGFDWEGIRLAFNKDLRRKRAVAGGSTITQQLAKNLFLSEKRSVARKIQEALITLMLEATWSKRRILEVYLNVIEWGDGVFGCAAAAEHYFHVPLVRIEATQAAQLASMIPRPRYYDRHGETDSLSDKSELITIRMQQVRIPP